jgi:hypothetical protein
MSDSKMGPLPGGEHVVLIGGGPGGAACATALFFGSFLDETS